MDEASTSQAPADAAEEGAVTPSGDAPQDGAEVAEATVDAERWARLEAKVESIDKRLAEYARLLHQRDEYVDKLHREAQGARQGLLREAVLPLIRRLSFVLDDLQRDLADRVGEESASPEPADDRLATVAEVLRDVMESYGVEFLRPETGDLFDAAQMQVKALRDTEDPAKGDRIAAILREGLRFENRLLRPADVEVWRRSDPPADGAKKSTSGGN